VVWITKHAHCARDCADADERDGVISQARAKELAERVLRKNAAELYKLR
jgi:hypothetical protein